MNLSFNVPPSYELRGNDRASLQFYLDGDTQQFGQLSLLYSGANPSFSLSGLKPACCYHFRLAIGTPYGWSPLTNIACFSTKPSAPLPPRNLRVAASSRSCGRPNLHNPRLEREFPRPQLFTGGSDRRNGLSSARRGAAAVPSKAASVDPCDDRLERAYGQRLADFGVSSESEARGARVLRDGQRADAHVQQAEGGDGVLRDGVCEERGRRECCVGAADVLDEPARPDGPLDPVIFAAHAARRADDSSLEGAARARLRAEVGVLRGFLTQLSAVSR